METVTSKDGTRIAYDRAGQGPAVILVDGALCYRNFGPMGGLSQQLAPHFTVFWYDRRGRGESGDTKPYAIEREIEDIDALIKAAGGSAQGGVYLYGISSGAGLALQAAACGLNIKKLALYEPPFMVDENMPRPAADAAQVVSGMSGGDAVEYFMTKMVGNPPEMVAGMRSSPVWPLLEAVGHTVAYDAAIMGENGWYLPKQVGSVRMPTLVMSGGNSPDHMHRAVQALEDVLPNARRSTIPNQDHNVAAEAIAPELIAFFKS